MRSWSTATSRGLLSAHVAAVAFLVMAPTAGAGTSVVEQIEQHVQHGIEANHVPGAALGMVTGDGEVHLQGFGTAGPGGASITPDTPFVIGSVTKPFTALAVLQLADRPLLDTARRLIGTTLRDAPGSSWEYANANYVQLGALAEVVSGQSYGQYLRTRVLEPLAMDRTFTDLAAAREAGMTDGHRFWFGRPVAHTISPEGLVPAGMLISTAADMTRYLRMLLAGGELEGTRILSETGVDELLRPAGGAIDRIGAGAVSLLMGPEPAAGRSLGTYHLAFNVAATALLLCALMQVLYSARTPRGASLRRRRLRWAAAAGIVALAAVPLVIAPLLMVGWRQAALWSPDHVVVLAALAALLLCGGGLQVYRLVRSGRAERRASSPSSTRDDGAVLVSSRPT